MRKLVTILGWGLLCVGVFWLLAGVLMAIQNDPRHPNGAMGGLLLGVAFGLPGVLILTSDRRRAADEAFRSQLIGFVRSHNAFTVEELAGKIGRTELETAGLVASLIEKEGLDLGFHRKTRQYLHRNRLKEGHRLIAKCPSCAAPIGQQIVFDGEEASCEYCGGMLADPERPAAASD